MPWPLIFQLINTAILPFWLLMMIAPRWRWTLRIMGQYIPPLVFAILYAGMLIGSIALSEGDGETGMGGMPQLEPIRAMLGTSLGTTLIWLHAIALDMMAGVWILKDAAARGVHPWLVRGVLLFTLMAGPLGFALYWALGYRGRALPEDKG